jgi:16S rRNA (uracil1498-N3)-methyltransferase
MRDGEFLARIEAVDKKAVTFTIEQSLRKPRVAPRKIHLLFAPIKKERMDFLIEKAVELGATDLHPVLTQNTDIRKINEERLQAQMIEAAEQCERMDIPALHAVDDLFKILALWNRNIPVVAALERFGADPLLVQTISGDCAVLIGPSGGFTQDEKEKLAALGFVRPVSLGENILRSETAAAAALAILTA